MSAPHRAPNGSDVPEVAQFEAPIEPEALALPRAPEAAPAERPTEGGEFERGAFLFTLLFLAAAVLVIGRTARDALFLTRFPVTWIAPMWMAYAVVSSVTALGYARYVSRIPRARFMLIFSVGAAASYVALRVMIGLEIRVAYLLFYVWSDVIANLTAIAAWTLANDLFDARRAKKVFGIIGLGQVLGTVVCGFSAGQIVRVIGTENLLVVLVFCLLAVGGVTLALERRHPLRRQPTRGPSTAGARRRDVSLRSPYIVAIAALTLLLFVSLTVGDYQFKAIARAAHADRDKLAEFMGTFYGGLGVVSLFAQIVIAPRLIRIFGVLGGLVTMPAAFLLGSLGLVIWPGLPASVALKGSDNGLQYTIYESTMQLLYFPFPEGNRDKIRTFISAIVKPVGCGVGAIALLVLVPDSGYDQAAIVANAAKLGYFTVPVTAVVLALCFTVQRGYVAAMRRSLMRHSLSALEIEPTRATIELLTDALTSQDAPQVVFAMEQLRELAPEHVVSALPTLAQHPSPRVRALALTTARALSAPSGPQLARRALNDEERSVRVAAIDAVAAMEHEDAHDELVQIADGAGPADDRVAAVAALLRYCGLDGMLEGAPRLQAMLESDKVGDRVAAARVLKSTGAATLQRALARLLADPEPAVRRAAIQAAAAVRSRKLLPHFLQALSSRDLVSPASLAIVALGDEALPQLAAMLADSSAPMQSRLVIPRLLFRIESPGALDVLLGRLNEPNVRLRQKILASASRLRSAIGAARVPIEQLSAPIQREISAHLQERDAFAAVRDAISRPLLDAAFIRRMRWNLIRILRLCELGHSRDTTAAVRAHLFGSDPHLRATAFEVLETLLDRSLRATIVPLFEDFVELRAGRFPPAELPLTSAVAAWVEREVASGEAYRAALALDAATHHRIMPTGPVALRALSSGRPLVRELALLAVIALQPSGAREAIEASLGDTDPTVASIALSTLNPTSAQPVMFTTVEKILLLQRIAVFSHVEGDELVTLARHSNVVDLRRGEVLFREGEPGGALYLVLSGTMKLTVAGREVSRLGPYEVFGEMSIFDRLPRAATAVCHDRAELLRVSADDFRDAVRETSEIAEAVIQILNRRLREADRRLAEVYAQLAAVTNEPPPSQKFGALPVDPADLSQPEDE